MKKTIKLSSLSSALQKQIKQELSRPKLEIRTGSHFDNKRHNEEQFKPLNALLLSQENPLYNKFDEEQFYLDDTDGLISIIKSSEDVEDLNEKELSKFMKFLRRHVSGSDLSIFIGDHITKL